MLKATEGKTRNHDVLFFLYTNNTLVALFEANIVVLKLKGDEEACEGVHVVGM